METTELKVTGMVCEGCVGHVEKAIQGVAGVESVEVDLSAGRAAAKHSGASEHEMIAAVAEAGYQAEVAQSSS